MDTQKTLQMQSVMRLPRAWDFLKQAVLYYKNNVVLVGGIFAVPFVLNVLQIFGVFGSFRIISTIITLVGYFSTLALLFALTKGEGKKMTIARAYSGVLPYILPAIWIAILAAATSLGGLILLIIPGIYIGLLLTFSLYALFLDDRRGVNALAQSWHFVRGSWVDVFEKLLFFLVGVVIVFVAITVFSLPFSHSYINHVTNRSVLVFPIFSTLLIQVFSTFFVNPISIIYSLFIYKTLSTKSEVTSEEKKSIRKKVFVFAIIGAIMMAVILLFTSSLIIQLFR